VARRDIGVAALLGPAEAELTCEECFGQLDRYVDLRLARADADHAILGMRAQLTGCPACRDDHDSLLEFVTISDVSQAPYRAPTSSVDHGVGKTGRRGAANRACSNSPSWLC
jgi:hypothetical protein